MNGFINNYINQFKSVEHIDLESTGEAVTITDPAGNIVNISQAVSAITGYSREELLGQNCSILSNSNTPKELYANLWKTISSNQIWRGNLINRRKNGKSYIADLTIFPVSFDDFTGYYSVQRDITEQFSHHQLSHNHRSIFSAILNASSLSIAMFDNNFNISFTNRGLEETYDEAFFYNILFPEIVEKLKSGNIQFHQQSQDIELDIVYRNQLRSFHCTIDPLLLQETRTECYFEPKEETHAILVINERTQKRKLLEEQRISGLKLLIADRKHVHSMQEVLMATVHQLQGPLNVIESAVKILNGRNHQCQGLEMMGQAVGEGFSALRYIQEHIPERPNEALQATNINEVIRDACSVSSEKLVNHYIQLDLDLCRDLPSINAMPSRLILALVQLIDNAIEQIDASRASERLITITSHRDKDSVSIAIEDSGGGIEPNMANKIFEPLYSSKAINTSGCRGLGLSIVQQVMNDHASMITVESSEHLSGAKFVIALPISCQEEGL
ncbi:nitrogen fixation negative regulator NifL [Vibrio sp. WXL210]|uniref:nitrogen fixation negative regulator NifL n=1 Tax=Vibrio sp. WXL210 TaxID=3450709 RepID=UPI003EC62C5A